MRYKELHEIVLPEACVIEGVEVLTLRPEERGTQKLFVNTDKIPKEKWEPPLTDEGGVVLCQALYPSIGEEAWTELHERFKEVCRKIGVKKAGRRIAGLSKVVWRKTEKELFFSAKKGVEAAFNRSSVLPGSLLQAWNVDMRIFEE